MNHLISVIVPIYNVEPYLKKCVDSIRNQTYKNLEIILVDDGSPDHCGKICDEYAKIDKRIKVIHKPNGGLSDARNAGLDIMTGSYVAFVDSDDWIADGYFEELSQLLEADIVYGGGVTLVYSEERMEEVYTIDEKKVFEGKVDYNSLRQLISSSLFGYACMKIYKREIIENLRFESIPFREDLIFNLRAYSLSQKIGIFPCVDYFYRQREQSLLHASFSKPVPPILQIAMKMIVNFKELSLEENRRLSEILLVHYLTDMISVCIMNNQTLDIKDKKSAIKKVFGDGRIKKILKYRLDDPKLFFVFKLCYKNNLSMLYMNLLRALL